MSATQCGSCGAPTGDGAALCQGCTGKLRDALRLAASIAPDLDDAVGKLLARGERGEFSFAHPPLPVDLAASDTARELRAQIRGWLLEVAPELRRAAPPETTSAMAVQLLSRLNRLRQQPYAGQAYTGITFTVGRAVAVVDRRPERIGCGRCDRCGAQSWAEGDEDTAVCERGHTVLNARQRRLNKAREADPLATPAEISAFLARHGYRVAESTISGWGTTGRIARHPGGFYRLSEALDMAARMGTRRPRVGG